MDTPDGFCLNPIFEKNKEFNEKEYHSSRIG